MCAVIALGASGCGDDDNADAGDEDSAWSSTSAEKDGGLHGIMERSTLFDPVRAFAVRVHLGRTPAVARALRSGARTYRATSGVYGSTRSDGLVQTRRVTAGCRRFHSMRVPGNRRASAATGARCRVGA